MLTKASAATALAILSASAAVAVPALAASKSVEVDDNYFVKDSGTPKVTVKKGTTVTWRWEGSNPHNVTVTKGPTKFHSKTISRGSYSKKLTKAGTYTIICTIHSPGMEMKLVVR
jgi:plastocyanin